MSCIAAIGPLYANRLNPVSWSFQAEQEKVAPGSTVMLRLHAQIADGYHLYSFTTPDGGPIKTRAWLQTSPDIKGFRLSAKAGSPSRSKFERSSRDL